MRLSLALMFLCVSGCSSTHEPVDCIGLSFSADLNQPFALSVGDRAVFESIGLQVRFEQVTADSRCPSNSLILCVWEGDGAVLVRVGKSSRIVLRDTLHTTLEPKTLELGDFDLELHGLAPYPETTDPIPAGEYEATFVLRLRN